MSFIVGARYTRDEIHAEVGGETQPYLPQHDGEIVCGCFKLSTNPHAPDEILVGSGPVVRRKASLFMAQRQYVPVFIKRAMNEWEYIGDYRVRDHTDDHAEIERKQREAKRTNVTRVLYLEQSPA